jgi:hypothetical protein
MIAITRYTLIAHEAELVASAFELGHIIDDPPACVKDWMSAQMGSTWSRQMKDAFLGSAGTVLGPRLRAGLTFHDLTKMVIALHIIQGAWENLPEGAPEMAESLARKKVRARETCEQAVKVLTHAEDE